MASANARPMIMGRNSVPVASGLRPMASIALATPRPMARPAASGVNEAAVPACCCATDASVAMSMVRFLPLGPRVDRRHLDLFVWRARLRQTRHVRERMRLVSGAVLFPAVRRRRQGQERERQNREDQRLD